MSTQIICDGCGQLSCEKCPEPEFTEVGIVRKCHYCQHALAVYREYEAERDRIHDNLVADWETRELGAREKLREQVAKVADDADE